MASLGLLELLLLPAELAVGSSGAGRRRGGGRGRALLRAGVATQANRREHLVARHPALLREDGEAATELR
eukprot:11172055-Lingulodinium_polyedra.AAC.1